MYFIGNADPVVSYKFGKMTYEALKTFYKDITFETYSNMGHSSCSKVSLFTAFFSDFSMLTLSSIMSQNDQTHLKILQQMLQEFKASDHFVTLGIKVLKQICNLHLTIKKSTRLKCFYKTFYLLSCLEALKNLRGVFGNQSIIYDGTILAKIGSLYRGIRILSNIYDDFFVKIVNGF